MTRVLTPGEHTKAQGEYQNLVRRHWWVLVLGSSGLIVLLVLIIGALGLFYPHGHAPGFLVALAVFLAMLGVAVYGIANVTVWALLVSWPCPRCDNAFNWRGCNAWPTGICRHCSLDLRTRVPPNNRTAQELKDA